MTQAETKGQDLQQYFDFVCHPTKGSLVHVRGREHCAELSLRLLHTVCQVFQLLLQLHALHTCFLLHLLNILSVCPVQLVSFQLKLCDMHAHTHTQTQKH